MTLLASFHSQYRDSRGATLPTTIETLKDYDGTEFIALTQASIKPEIDDETRDASDDEIILDDRAQRALFLILKNRFEE